MKRYQIVYKLKNDNKDYYQLFQYIETLDSVHIIDNVWWIKTDLNISSIIKKKKKYLEATDFFYVTELNQNIDGWLATTYWKWLKE